MQPEVEGDDLTLYHPKAKVDVKSRPELETADEHTLACTVTVRAPREQMTTTLLKMLNACAAGACERCERSLSKQSKAALRAHVDTQHDA